MQRIANWTTQVGECQVWAGSSAYGYGTLKWEGTSYRVHRLMWEMYHGRKLDRTEDVHHTCENRLCVSPLHLKVMTRAEHRRWHSDQIRVCKWGHRYDAENTYVDPSNGQRSCRKCHADRARKRKVVK